MSMSRKILVEITEVDSVSGYNYHVEVQTEGVLSDEATLIGLFLGIKTINKGVSLVDVARMIERESDDPIPEVQA